MNGLIEISTGDLVKKGYCDFTIDPNFDNTIHEQRTDVPENAKVNIDGTLPYSRYLNSAWSIVELTDAEKLAINIHLKNLAIDNHTKELIELGFLFAGNQFSLSKEAQLNATGLKIAGDGLIITYPLQITTLSDAGFDLVDLTSLNGWYMTGLGTKKARLDSGRALKLQCNACTTQAELDLIIDNR